ncbi:MAG: phenylalanine--tRNA ligase subunit beta [Candidatus Melainabacteria bacterium GWF2_37_15]|nr:MAG: phenylalanine--tRNA ligase subunit beta [Candidatus Melainabacteria bacterium GWF2_37_15]
MLVSLEWLSEYVDLTGLEPEEIAHALTMSGLEVEEIEKIKPDFSNIVVAEILDVKPHPNADKLQLAKVFNGTEEKEVVCGARNIAKGQFVPYATIGSEVKDRKTGEKFTLKPVAIRGVESQGMLCSAGELGLESEEDGILILKNNPTPGTDIKKVLNLREDTILHVAPTANRGDEMSLIGIAREVCAIFNRPIKLPAAKNYNSGTVSDFQVEIKDPDTCKYYAAGIVKDVKIGPSPDWMAARLNASGVRSINNVVDITNYVMLEYGQPLHAFDMSKLDENYLCVRRAHEGETLVTLDETERKLNKDTVLIATKQKSVGLAGLMGGFNSEVDENTTNIALESAYFTPPTNRKSSRSVGLRTEASARFERGIDIEAVKPALIRAMNLMEEYAGARIEGIVETGQDKLPDIDITLRFEQIKRILGIEIPKDKCIEILKNLGFKQLLDDKFRAPSFRANDVTREIDLIEEISRIYGYDKIESTLPQGTAVAQISHETQCINKIHKLLLAKGLNEVVTSSLIGEPLLKWFGIRYSENQAVKVTNPQSDEYTMLRQSLIPSIAQVIKYNFDQGQKDVWIYETGKTFFFTGNVDQKSTGTQEKRVLAGAITGDISSSLWGKAQEADFYTLKGLIELLVKEFKLDNRIQYQPVTDIQYLHPGKAAQVILSGKEPKILGTFGELHPDTTDKCKLSQSVYLFEIDIDALLDNISYTVPRYKEIPHYPAVTRDIAFIIPENVSYQDITQTFKKFSGKLFKKADIFDLYKGEHVPEGSKSVAIRIMLQNPEATLTDEEVDKAISSLKSGVKKAYPDINFRE